MNFRKAKKNKEKELQEKTWALLDNFTEVEPSPDFSRRLYERIARSETEPALKLFRLPKFSLQVVPAVVTAVVLLFFASLYFRVNPPIKQAEIDQSQETEQADVEVIENLELLEYLDLLEELDVVNAQEDLGRVGLSNTLAYLHLGIGDCQVRPWGRRAKCSPMRRWA